MSAAAMDEVDWGLLGSVESLQGGDPEAGYARVLADQVDRWRQRPADEPLAREQFLEGWARAVADRAS